MVSWSLTETHQTSAGAVAAGRVGEGPDLVLAHGWPWSSLSWRRVIPHLAQRFRVHWYDMPGYGRSEMRAGQRTSLDVQGEVFAEMLEIWGLRRPDVIAHDFGGAATLRAQLLHGCAYNRYILMNVVAMRPWGSEFFDHVGRHIDAFRGLPPHIHRAIVEAYIRGAFARPPPEDDVAALAEPWLTDAGAESFYSHFAQADERYTAEVEAQYDAVGASAHILWGEDDPWIPLDRGRALHAQMPQASFATLPGAGHMPQLEAPDALLAQLDRLLR